MTKIKTIEERATLTFKIVYLLHVLLAFNCFTMNLRVLNISSLLITMLGALLLVQKIIRNKCNFSHKYLWVLIMFLLSYFASSLVNWNYGYMNNVKGMVWMIFQFFLLYWVDAGEGAVQRELRVFSATLIGYTALCSLAGFVMAVLGYGGRTNFSDGSGTFYGFVWGRLWGCYTDPNHGALITAVAILAAIHFLRIAEKKWVRNLLIISLVLNYLYIVLSDSRSAKLSLTIGIFVWMCILLKARRDEKREKQEQVKKVELIKPMFLICLCTVLLYSSFGLAQNGYNFIIQHIYVTEDGDIIEDDPTHLIGRDDEVETDYSNRRFDIWESGVEIFSQNKIFGVSFRNILPYAEQEMKDTYIVNNDSGKFDSFHNVVIDVLASQGLVGIVIFLIFVIAVIAYVFRRGFWDGICRNSEVQFLMISVLVIAIDAMFISAVFYVNSPETIVFWTLLGTLICRLKKKEN